MSLLSRDFSRFGRLGVSVVSLRISEHVPSAVVLDEGSNRFGEIARSVT